MDIIKATKDNLDLLLSIRFEVLRVVNCLSEDTMFSDELIDKSREYFLSAEQTTALAIDKNETIGCASICYINIMPSFDHPTGKRAHIMNVYTREGYRRQGVAKKMMEFLIEEAKEKGVTEISLDATELGRPLYEKCGFVGSKEGMLLNLKET